MTDRQHSGGISLPQRRSGLFVTFVIPYSSPEMSTLGDMATPRPQLSPFDPNLSAVLQRASRDQLLPLVRRLTGGFTCRLSPEARREPEKNVIELQAELQAFGGNTFSNFFKGSGASYQQVVSDVAEKKFAIQTSGMSVFGMEEEILRSIPTKGEQASTLREALLRNTPMLASEGFKRAGFLPYKYAVIIANKCSRFVWKRGLKAAANRAITAGLKRATSAFIGPVGWAITITDLISTVWKAAGPNLTVTQPCVIYIAVQRRSLI